jgi:hypothetical protein
VSDIEGALYRALAAVLEAHSCQECIDGEQAYDCPKHERVYINAHMALQRAKDRVNGVDGG